MRHKLPSPRFAFTAFEPFLDAPTTRAHYEYHGTCVARLNATLDSHPELHREGLENLLRGIHAVPADIRTAVREAGGGLHNHSLLWTSLLPNARERRMPGPGARLENAIGRTFGGFAHFQELFTNVGSTWIGSGWVWLALDGEALEVFATANEDSPLMNGKTPLLGLDVWEHAYYPHYRHRRFDYIAEWWNLVNWREVDRRFAAAARGSTPRWWARLARLVTRRTPLQPG
jgi:Fe-Mn family superoxide dismutase